MVEMEEVLIKLQDPATNIVYTCIVSEEDGKKINSDKECARNFLKHIIQTNKDKSKTENADVVVECRPNDLCLSPSESSKKRIWPYADTLLLLGAVDLHSEQFNHPKKRRHVWEDVAGYMSDNGTAITAAECTIKWKNLLRTYKACKDKKLKSGRQPVRFHFYDRMDALLLAKPYIASPHHADVGVAPAPVQAEAPAAELDASPADDAQPDGSDARRRRKDPRSCYFQAKINFLIEKQKHSESRRLERKQYKQTRLQLERRKVQILEDLLALHRDRLDP